MMRWALMWYIQINNEAPQLMGKSGAAPWIEHMSNSTRIAKWHHRIKTPQRLQMLYIFNDTNSIKHRYSVTVTIGSLPTFYLGNIDNINTALQSEPNFCIQRGTKVMIYLSRQPQQKEQDTGA
eukprot:744494_1